MTLSDLAVLLDPGLRPAQAAVGALFTALYVVSGSLLSPIIVHIALDVRGLLLTHVAETENRTPRTP